MGRYVALLRGINVGGQNPVGMPALKAFFEAQGFVAVATYIQSGNVVFSSGERRGELASRLEAGLAAAFGFPGRIVLRSREQLRRVVDAAPAGFGARPALYRYDVIFLREPLTAAEALAAAPSRPGVDAVSAGPGVLYFSRLIEKASQSRMSRIVALPMYQSMTIRNWNTTTRLLTLLDGEAPGPARRQAGRR
jgi:uncharacterized protein (DUF1697 family)